MKVDTNEQYLLKGFANNDAKAIEYIYKDVFPSIQTFILNNNGSYDDARDIFQEAMIALYEKAKQESFVLTCQIKTYVYSICRRLWLKRLQQMGKFVATSISMEETIAVEDDLEAHKKKQIEYTIMEQALNNLGEPCKSIIEAYYIKKKGMLDIAQDFGYTNADNAKNQKYKCLIRLKKLFFAQYNIGE